MKKYKKIGIIGGQGPASTIDIYTRVIKYFQDKFCARYVQDFPPMVIFSVPTPSLVKSVENEEKTFSIMAEAIMIACTELPIILKQSDVNMPLIDCNELYSQTIAQYSSETT